LSRICILFILCFCSILALQAQQVTRYTTDNGLPSNHIYQVEQDKEGFMWFGTTMGIVKFDGKDFRIFTTKDRLPNNDVWRLEATPNGKMWYFSKSKRLGYIYRDSVFSFEIEGGLIQTPRIFIFNGEDVGFNGLYEKDNAIFQLIDLKWQVTYHESKLKYFDELLGKKTILLHDGKKIAVGKDEELLLNKNHDILYTFKRSKDNTTAVHESFGYLNKFSYHKDKNIFVFMNPYSVGIFNLNDSTIYNKNIFSVGQSLEYDATSYPELQRFGEKFQISLLDDWILIDDKLNVLERKKFPTGKFTVHVFKDYNNNYWSIGHEYGIMVNSKPTLTNKYYFDKKKIQTINYENGNLFINVFNEGWYTLDPKTGEQNLIIENNGKIYDMGYHKGLKKYYFYHNRCIWQGENLNNLYPKCSLALNISGIGMHESAGGAKSIIETDSGFRAINMEFFIDFDKNFNVINNGNRANDDWSVSGVKLILNFKNELFYGGDGLYKSDLKRTKKITSKKYLLQAPVNTMIPFNDEFMLVGTDGFGAYFYDGQDKTIPIKGTEGFSINKIIIDNNDIWIATGKGIHLLKKNSQNEYVIFESIYDEDGLFENNVNTIYILENKLYVGQDNGLIEIDLQKEKYKRPVNPYYNGTKNFDRNTNTYTIDYGNNISLPFGVLSLPSQKYIKYYYKIGSDPWVPTDVSTLVMGKQLPGNYLISFKAVDQHGNTGETSINLVVLPLWHQTIYTKFAAIAVLITCVILITIFFRRKSEKRKKDELILSKTLSDLELKALRSQMNPHFVFNSLNAIQYYIVKNKSELSEEYLAKFSRLIRLFFEYSKYESLKISQEVDLLRRYLEIEKLRFENKLEYSIYVDPEIDVEDTEVPSMILQPIVENAVNHGIFHKKGNGLIKLGFTRMNESAILISIIDDGVGVLAMKEIQQEDSVNYRSKSSEVIKERLKILSENKLSKWKVDYKIVDRSTINPKETGTVVEIILHFNY